MPTDDIAHEVVLKCHYSSNGVYINSDDVPGLHICGDSVEDMKPVIGRVPRHERMLHERMFVAAGHYRKGIMQSPVTGKILADLVTRGETDLPVDAFAPERFPLAGAVRGS